MSSTVDNRVVEMGFNNKQFEQGVKQSTESLDKLKKSLDLSESARNISNLTAAGKKFSLASMGEGVDRISSKFSALGVVGFTVIQNLTNAAIEFGRKMVSSILDPAKQGFAEYETQMNAIQTVLANTESKGTTLKDVGAALDELNTYADKTIYNFTEMTRNIGTFTAAGVDLDTSVAAIKGIANLAAVSGSNSQQASTAMYQLSQALSSGTVKLMDWNSVVNAGMGGQVFQDALKETARVHGIAIDDMIENEGSFRETLQEGWLTSEVLLETLQKFTGDLTESQLQAMGYTEEQIKGITKLGQTANDAATKVKTFTQLKETLQEAIQSGWTKSWEIVIGDFEEAKGFFTEVSDTLGGLIQQSSDARNALLQNWKDLGGRTALIETIRNTFNGLLSILGPIKEAFQQIFPPTTGEQLYKLTVLLQNLSSKLILSSENAERVKRIFLGLFSVFGFIKDVIFALGESLFNLVKGLNISGGGILEFLAGIGDYLYALREGVDVSGAFAEASVQIKNVLNQATIAIDGFTKALKEKFETIKNWFSELFEDVDTSGFEKFLKKIQIRFEPLTALARIAAGLMAGILKVGKTIMPVLFKVASAVGEFVFNISASIYNAIKDLKFNKILDLINSGLLGAILLGITKFLTSGRGALDELGGMFGGVSGILDEVRGTLVAYQTQIKAKALLSIAIAIGILALSLALLASIDSGRLTAAILAITSLFVELTASMGVLNKLGSTGLSSTASLLAISTSLLILAGAIYVLSKVSSKDVTNALGTIFALMAGLAVFSKVMSRIQGSLLKSSVGLIAFGLALMILVGVIKLISTIKPDQLTKGLLGLGAMLLEIAVFMRILNNTKMSPMAGLGLIGMAVSLLILVEVVKKLGDMDVDKIQQGMIAVGILLAQLAIFTKITGGKGMITTAAGMVILAGAMMLLTDVISVLGSMSWESLVKGLVGMGIALLLLAGAVRAMPKSVIFIGPALVAVAGALFIMSKALQEMGGMSWEEIGKGLLVLAVSLGVLTATLYAMTGTLAGSLALIIAAGALLVLSQALQAFGSMSLTEIGLALLALVGIFAVLGVAGLVLAPLVPVLLGLGAALLLLGLGTLLVSAGILAFSIALTTLAAAGTAAAVVVVAMVGTLLGVIPLIIQTLIDAIILFGQGVITAVPVLAEALTALILGVLQVIIDITPKLLETLGVLIDALIQLVRTKIPDFVSAIIELVVTLLQEIAAKVPDFVQAGFDILIGFLEGISNNIGEVVTVAIEIVLEFIAAVAAQIPDIIQSGIDLMIAFIDGIAQGIENNSDRLNNSLANLAKAIIDGVVSGISSGATAVWEALKAVVQNAIAGLLDFLESDSPSKVFARIAESIPSGMVVGISSMADDVAKSVESLADGAITGMNGVAERIAESMSENVDISPVIRPVVDMNDIIESGILLDETFSGSKGLNIVPIVDRYNEIAERINGNGYDDKSGSQKGERSIQLNQYNYSPKPLDRLDIYRQTRIQIQTLKGLVEP